MKNTKNTLITGIALATALFTSVQVTAMEPSNEGWRMSPVKHGSRFIHEFGTNNTFTNPQRLNEVRIVDKNSSGILSNSSIVNTDIDSDNPENVNIYRKKIKANKAMLYGNENPNSEKK